MKIGKTEERILRFFVGGYDTFSFYEKSIRTYIHKQNSIEQSLESLVRKGLLNKTRYSSKDKYMYSITQKGIMHYRRKIMNMPEDQIMFEEIKRFYKGKDYDDVFKEIHKNIKENDEYTLEEAKMHRNLLIRYRDSISPYGQNPKKYIDKANEMINEYNQFINNFNK